MIDVSLDVRTITLIEIKNRTKADKRKEAGKKWKAANSERWGEYRGKWLLLNKDKISEYQKKYRLKNKEKIKEAAIQWHLNNPKRMKESRASWYARHPGEKEKILKAWRKENREKVKISHNKSSKKIRKTIRGKLNCNIGSSIRQSLFRGTKRKRHWEDLVGYSICQLKEHLEVLFDNHMSWENYGTIWEIDHKIPISAHNFSSPEDIDFKKCWALKNLQPLEKSANNWKRAKLTKPFQPSLRMEV